MKRWKMIAAGAVVVLLAFSSAFLGARLGGATVAPAEAKESSASTAQDDTGIRIPGYDKIILQAGKLAQEISLENPAENSCYFTVALLLPDSEVLAVSGLIVPGGSATDLTLARTLQTGTYEGAILRYSCFDLATGKKLNGADVATTLEVIP